MVRKVQEGVCRRRIGAVSSEGHGTVFKPGATWGRGGGVSFPSNTSEVLELELTGPQTVTASFPRLDAEFEQQFEKLLLHLFAAPAAF